MTHLKLNKVPKTDRETDGILAEMIKLLGEDGFKIIHNICNKVRQSQQWPEVWTKSAYIPKQSTQKCQNYRTKLITDRRRSKIFNTSNIF